MTSKCIFNLFYGRLAWKDV